MKRRAFGRVIIILLAAFMVAPGAVQAQAMSPAEQFASRVAGRVLDAANNGSSAEFQVVLREHADVAAISKIAAGRYGRGLSKAERHKLEQAVERMIARGFAKHSQWLRGQSIEVTDSTSDGGRTVTVTTRIVGGSLETVEWKLAKLNDGFSVVDINIGGVWLSLQMRSTLSSKLKRSRGDVMAAIAD